ncbi:MAG: hypothetical protein N3A69_05240, partial [Leptospiraceae bacterium]|nr:hypothetical protein [Leptospiraceae bacterium]
ALEDCNITTNSRVVFQNLRLKEFYSHQEYYEEKILSVGEPFPENVYTEYSGCHCCCGDIGNNLYFLFQDKIQYVNFSLNNSKGKCLHSPGEDFEYYQENRIDKENKVIYSLLKLPVCRVLEESNILEKQENESEPIDYSHTLFVVLKVEKSHINIEKYYDEDIPNTYKKDWEKLK